MNSGKNHFLLSLLAALTALGTAEAAGTSGNTVPKVVVNILIDQLRTDYLNAFMPLYGNEGFRRLMEDGRVYSQAEYPMIKPDRASATATVATGAPPSGHGIIAQKWMDRSTLRPMFCVDDPAYQGVGTTDGTSPRHLGVSTMGDELKVATEGKAAVYGIAPFREAAVFSAGHAADAALWIDEQTGLWCTSNYYTPTLPTWVSTYNERFGIDKRLKATVWQPSSELVGNFSYFLSGEQHAPFKHKFKGDDRFSSYLTSGFVNQEVVEMVKACLRGTAVGMDAFTDYMAITFYAGNFKHQPTDIAPIELQDIYVRLDGAVADLISAIEHRVGHNNALFVLTSTGYADEETADLSKYRIPSGTFDMQRATALLNMYLVALHGQGQFVETCIGNQIYLNHRLIEQKQLRMNHILEQTQEFLLTLSGVKDVYTSQRLLQGAWTPGISRIRSAYNPRFSGDIMIEVTPGWRCVNELTKENKLSRESYISFPIIFYGAGIAPSIVETPVSVDRIAPTISKSIRIRAPNACGTAPLF
jgi:hypothetical protein